MKLQDIFLLSSLLKDIFVTECIFMANGCKI